MASDGSAGGGGGPNRGVGTVNGIAYLNLRARHRGRRVAICLIMAIALALLPGLQQDAGAITGGEDANEPWSVLLVDRDFWRHWGNGVFPDGFSDHFCSGSLIAREWVLTAAHCVDEDGWSVDLAVIGRADLRGDIGYESEIAVHPDGSKQLYPHPCYVNGDDNLGEIYRCETSAVGANMNWDLALIRLKNPVPDSYRVLPLAPKGVNHIGQKVNLYGYGLLVQDPPQEAEHLKRTPDGVYTSNGWCHNTVGNLYPYTLCFGDGGNPNVEVNSGDSGSPWTHIAKGDRVQVAVHSNGASPAEHGVDVVDRGGGGITDPWWWVRSTAGLITARSNTILRNVDDGHSWLVGSDGFRRPIPNGGDYQCFVDRGARPVNLYFVQISQVPEAPGEPAKCNAAPSGTQRDIVFVVDTTGSMGDDIDAVKASANSVVSGLSGSFRVALVDYKDHRTSGGDSGDYPSRLNLDFSSDKSAIVSAINRLGANGGGDTPESAYSGIMRGLSLSWRSSATRSIIWMGDAPPKDPEPITGYTKARVVSAALSKGVVVGPETVPGALAAAPPLTASEGTPSAAFRSAVAAEDVEGGEVFTHAAQIFAVEIGGAGGPAYRELPEETGGKHFSASNASEVVEALTDAIEAAVGLEPVSFALAAQVGTSSLQALGSPSAGGTDGVVRGLLHGRALVGAEVDDAGRTTMNDEEVLIVRFTVDGIKWELRYRVAHRGQTGSVQLCGPSACESGVGTGLVGAEAENAPGLPAAISTLTASLPAMAGLLTSTAPPSTSTTIAAPAAGPSPATTTVPSTTTTTTLSAEMATSSTTTTSVASTPSSLLDPDVTSFIDPGRLDDRTRKAFEDARSRRGG